MDMPDYALCGPPYNRTAKPMQPIKSFTDMKAGMDELQKNYDGIMSSLQEQGKDAFAFNKADEERDTNLELDDDDEAMSADSMPLERPVTPINDEIKVHPASVAELSRLVRRRIEPKPDSEHLSEARQKELASVIMGEVNWTWGSLKTKSDDPFLSPSENHELHRRLIVQLVTTCQDLFLQYIEKFSFLNMNRLFSEAATMSRLKGLLSIDAHKHLDVHRLRRQLLQKIKTERVETRTIVSPQSRRKWATVKNLSFLLCSPKQRPSSTSHMKHRAMPTLDMGPITKILSEIPQERLMMALSKKLAREQALDTACESGAFLKLTVDEAPVVQKRKTSDVLTKEKILIKKAMSSIDLSSHVTLLHELDLDEGLDKDGRQSDCGLTQRTIGGEKEVEGEKAEESSRDVINRDLQELLRVGCVDDTNEVQDKDENLPPLLQAILRSARHDDQISTLQRRLAELRLKEKLRKEKEKIRVRPPLHMQPNTTSSKMRNQMEMRSSDSRVSERVCLSTVTLTKHPTVYNDLVNEIDADTLKQLDSNLFRGDEITEVYKEIMKTVSKDHLRLDNDPSVMTAPLTIDMSDTYGLASPALALRRVTNPALRKGSLQAPWRSVERDLWARTPTDPPRDKKGRALINPMTPRGEGTTPRDLAVQDAAKPPRQSAEQLGEVMGRAYTAWSTWWKSNVNSEDYLKYLSTQNSDYLSTVFHLYDSSDDDDADATSRSAQPTDGLTQPGALDRLRGKGKQAAGHKQAHLEEMRKKTADLQLQKSEYHAGFWNTNSVMMGGLGRDPECEDEEESGDEEEVEEKAQAKVVELRTRIVSKRAQRMEQSHREEESRRSREEGKRRKSSAKRPDRPTSRHTTSESVERSFRVDMSVTDEDTKVSTQERLDNVWVSLRMPDKLRLDMAIKYSSDTYIHRIEEGLSEWEKATDLILRREFLITQLERFEKTASDPNRFFEIGYRGSAVARLTEARVRSTFYKKMEPINRELNVILDLLKKTFSDIVTYQGRNYAEKMHWDRTEMLYWLQEDRKEQALIYENALVHLTANANMLPSARGKAL